MPFARAPSCGVMLSILKALHAFLSEMTLHAFMSADSKNCTGLPPPP
jgi:hypothetical protein